MHVSLCVNWKSSRNLNDFNDGGGRYNLQTVSGDNLTVQLKGKKLYLIDESGSAARITIADVNQSNGVIHVTNGVSVPR